MGLHHTLRQQANACTTAFFSRSIILNTSEHRSTIKALLVGTLQQELQVTSRQILGGLPKSLATLMLSLPFVPGSPACIKRWRFLARFLSSFAASRTCRFKSERRWRRAAISWCSKAWPAHESCTMLKMMVSCASPHRNNMLLLQIRADPLCDFTPNSFEPRQRFASVRNSPNLFFAAAPLSAQKTQLKSSTWTRSCQVARHNVNPVLEVSVGMWVATAFDAEVAPVVVAGLPRSMSFSSCTLWLP